jgi:hypothetical protein
MFQLKKSQHVKATYGNNKLFMLEAKKKHVSIPSGQNVEILRSNLTVYIITTGLKKVE